MSYLRATDRDQQCRSLRRLLPGTPPSSWMVVELLDYTRRTIRRRSPDVELLAQAARTLALWGHDDVATDYCRIGRAIDPAKFYAILANFVHHRRGDMPGARVAARAGLAVTWHRSVDKADLLLALAKAEMRLGELDAATIAYETCIVQNVRATSPVAHLGLSWVSQLRRDFAEARRQNDRARRLFEEDGDSFSLLTVYSDRAVLEYSSGHNDLAEEQFRRAIEGRRRRMDTQLVTTDLSNYAVLLRSTGRPRRAIALLSEAVRYAEHQSRDRAAAGIYINLGNCLDEVGNRAAALAAHARAATISSRIPAEDYEFRALVSLLDLLDDGREFRLPAHVVRRCRSIASTARRSLSAETLAAFERMLERKPRLSDVEYVADDTALDAALTSESILDIADALRDEVGTGPPSKVRIDPRQIVDFLWHYAGDAFRNRDYRSELSVDRPAARSHLRWLTLRRIVQKDGHRRGAVYRLATLPR